MAGKISEMTAAVSALDADQVELLQSGANKRATVAMLRATTLPLAGGTMTGDIVLAGAPSAANHPATKNYVDTGLATKAASAHSHAMDDVTGLVAALSGKAPSSHSHVTTDITGLAEAIDDRVAALLVAGDNVTLTYDDNANTLTIDAAGGGGGGGYDKLTTSGDNDGIFTFKDDTPTTGATCVIIAPGAVDTPNGLFWVGDPAGTPGFHVTRTGDIWVGDGINHWFETWAIGPTGALFPSTAEIAFTDGGSYFNTRDTKLRRSGVSTLRAADQAGDPANFEVGTLYLDDGVGLFDVLIGPDDSGPGGAGRVLYIANAA